MIMRKYILNRKLHWIALVGLSVALMSILLLSPRETVVPIERFLGVWETSAPKYKDRFLKITESTISFGTGDGNANEFIVGRVIKKVEAEKTVYTILYREPEGIEFKLAFYYNPKNNGVIRLKNQPEIEWTRLKQ